MAINIIEETINDGSITIRRVVEERTARVEIFTPLMGTTTGYRAVAYREWVEYHDGVAVKITPLPPVQIEITEFMAPLVRMIAGSIDNCAISKTKRQLWPKDNDGSLMKP